MKEEWLAAADGYLLWAAVVLFLLLALLAAVWRNLAHHTVRIYNWDGKKYRFLGRERLWRVNDTYVVKMRERVGDWSYTTRYLLFASAKFVKRHRYENLLLRAGAVEVWLPVEERMRAEVLYAHRQGW
ncbi:MAG: hypothetical protein OSJ72_16450 [Lachnospiraceae bacterium]|nr:hypothetical protein [Lachnospiraceae bacterium]